MEANNVSLSTAKRQLAGAVAQRELATDMFHEDGTRKRYYWVIDVTNDTPEEAGGGQEQEKEEEIIGGDESVTAALGGDQSPNPPDGLGGSGGISG